MDRRRLLTLGGLAGGAVLVSPSRVAGLVPDGPTGRTGTASAPAPAPAPGHHLADGTGAPGAPAAAGTPFTVPMPVPPVLRPTGWRPGVDQYDLPIRAADVEVLPGLRTAALTYGGQFVGPTIRARSGRRVAVRYHNQLDRPVNVHLHGGHVAPGSDGHPMDLIEPGGSRVYEYPNGQRGATLWYHDHSHHTEAEHCYRGLHGFYLIDDDHERLLGLPAGQYDVPILLRDGLFDESGALVFDPMDPAGRPTVLANGRPQPYFGVAARKYRLRLLNGSLHRIFRLRLNGAPMVQISSDGGLLPAPVPLTELVLSPAERADVVVDLSRHPVGHQLVLTDTSGPVLRLDVTRGALDLSRLPDRLRPLPPLPPATAEREVDLSFDPAVTSFTIDGRTFDADRVDMQIPHGATEIWRITNRDTAYAITHNFHLHLVQFRVLERDGRPPGPGESGLKDTLLLPPGGTVRVQATFAGFRGRYVYHCHMLEHSQLGMMAQMEVA